MIDTRVIYCGDNLDQLRKLPDSCADLVYIDPKLDLSWSATMQRRCSQNGNAHEIQPHPADLSQMLTEMATTSRHISLPAFAFLKIKEMAEREGTVLSDSADFDSARGLSAVNSLMIKCAVSALLGLLSLCLPLAAQQTDLPQTGADTITREQLLRTGEVDTTPALTLYRPDIFSTVDGSLLIHDLPVLTLLDGRRFPISSELERIGITPLDLVPLAFLRAVEVQKVSASPMYGTDGPGGVADLRLNRNYSGGEMGVFYGKSSGQYGREDFQTYIVGGVGNDKFHITAGAAYEESNGRVPRLGR